MDFILEDEYDLIPRRLYEFAERSDIFHIMNGKDYGMKFYTEEYFGKRRPILYIEGASTK